MKTYNCGGQQNQEKNSKLKTAAKNFFKSSKELGVALGEEAYKAVKTGVKLSKSIDMNIKNKVIDFLSKHPKALSLTIDGTAAIVGLATSANAYAHNSGFVSAINNKDFSAITPGLVNGVTMFASAYVGVCSAIKIHDTLKHPNDNKNMVRRFIVAEKKSDNNSLKSFVNIAMKKLKNSCKFAPNKFAQIYMER